jgi:DNA primase
MAATRYERELQGPNGVGVLAYLLARGLPPSVVRDYRLGQVDAGSPDHGDDMAGWISIPYLTRAGVVGFKFRNPVDGAKPKYLSGHHESRLYNTPAMDQADREGRLGIVEGEFDAIVNTALVGIPTVGIPGVDTYQAHPEWRELFRGYQEVLIFEDQDEINKITGKRPGRELATKLKADIDTSRIVRVPAKDVNDCYLKHGKNAVLQAAGLLLSERTEAK